MFAFTVREQVLIVPIHIEQNWRWHWNWRWMYNSNYSEPITFRRRFSIGVRFFFLLVWTIPKGCRGFFLHSYVKTSRAATEYIRHSSRITHHAFGGISRRLKTSGSFRQWHWREKRCYITLWSITASGNTQTWNIDGVFTLNALRSIWIRRLLLLNCTKIHAGYFMVI